MLGGNWCCCTTHPESAVEPDVFVKWLGKETWMNRHFGKLIRVKICVHEKKTTNVSKPTKIAHDEFLVLRIQGRVSGNSVSDTYIYWCMSCPRAHAHMQPASRVP